MIWTKWKSHWKLIVLLIIPSALFAMLLIEASKNQAIRYLEERQRTNMLEMAEQSSHIIRNHMDRVADLLLEVERTIVQEQTGDDQLAQYLETVGKVRFDLIRGIVFWRDDGTMIGYPESYWPAFARKELNIIEAQALHQYPPIRWSPPDFSNIGRYGSLSTVSMVSKRVYDNGRRSLGRLSVAADMTSFLSKTISIADQSGAQVLLYDQEKRLIDSYAILPGNPLRQLPKSNEATRELEGALQHFRDNGFYFATSTIPAYANWQVVVVTDLESVEKSFPPVTRLSLFALGVAMFGFLCIYWLVSWSFTRPIREMMAGMRRISKGDLQFRMHVPTGDEFGEMAQQFNRMSERIERLVSDLKETEERKRVTEMRSLLTQINPHLLYNTLNMIDDLIDTGTAEQLHRVVEALAQLLQYSLDRRPSNERSFSEELENVLHYWHIVTMRYDRQFTLEVSERARRLGEARLPKLTLQPIVENALFHGLLPRGAAGGTVWIDAERAGEHWAVIVRDNGVGIAKERLADVRSGLNNWERPGPHGIGIGNVHQRVALAYGVAYGIDIHSEAGNCTEVSIRIPYRTEVGLTGEGSVAGARRR